MMTGGQKEELSALLDEVGELCGRPRNLANAGKWKAIPNWNRDMPRSLPSPSAGRAQVVAALGNGSLGALFGMDLREFYQDPLQHLRGQLLMKRFHLLNWPDDSHIDMDISIWFGVITELSYVGAPIEFYADREGWIKGPILDDLDRVDCLELDFRKSGLMPKAHEFYEVLGEICAGRARVMFPDWVRGPFCLAAHLRGLDKLLMDMLLTPDKVHRLMRRLVDLEKAWVMERARMLGEPLHPGKIFDDEVDCPTVSPALVAEFILPYERELAEFYGGLVYWHSCGNTTAFFPQIDTLPGLRMVHISPWSDLRQANRVYGREKAFEVCFHPVEQILTCDEKTTRTLITQTLAAARGRTMVLRGEAFVPFRGLSTDLASFRRWIEVACDVCQHI